MQTRHHGKERRDMPRIVKYSCVAMGLLVCFLSPVFAGLLEDELLEASEIGNTGRASQLIKKGANVNARDADGQTPLIKASANGHEKTVVELLNAGAHMQLFDKEGRTALIEAARNNRPAVVALLLEKGANIHTKDALGRDALMYACRVGSQEMVAKLVQWGANLNVSDNNNETGIIIACKQGHAPLVSYLLHAGAHVPAEGKLGSELLKACMRGDLGRVKTLLDQGADPDSATRHGNCSAVFVVSCLGYADVLDALIEKKARLTNKGDARQVFPSLIYAAKNGHLRVLEKLIREKTDLNGRDEDGDTALTLAAEKGHVDVIDFLTSHGANVNVSNKAGESPLFLAADSGHKEAVRSLLEKKANPNSRDKRGRTPLIAASTIGDRDIVNALLERGAEVDAADEKGKTAVIEAVRHGHLEVLNLLLEKGAKPDKQMRENGWTALLEATKHNRVEEARSLLNHGASPDLKDRKGSGPLHYAAARNFKEILSLLLDTGAARDLRDSDGWTPLIAAASNGHQESVALLIEAGADVNAKTKKGISALMLASYDGYLPVVELLWEHGADINAVDDKGRSALFYTAAVNRVIVAKLLLEKGALPDLKDKDGITPLMVAVSNGHIDFIKLLLKNGADVNAKVRNVGTVLQLAEKLRKPEVVEILTRYVATGIAAVESQEEKGGYLGVDIRDVKEKDFKGLRLFGQGGAFVFRVLRYSPAWKAGVQPGDVILKCNDIEIASAARLKNLVHSYPPGKSVALTIWREGRMVNLTAEIGKVPGESSEEVYAAKEAPHATIADLVRRLDAAPGDELVERPPTQLPNDRRYFVLSGVIETREGDIVICRARQGSFSAGPSVLGGKWAFNTKGMRDYVPRINQEVEVIGKIGAVIKGQLVIGAPVHVVVLDAEYIMADGQLYEKK